MKINSISSYNYNINKKNLSKNKNISFGNAPKQASKNIFKRLSDKVYNAIEPSLIKGIEYITKQKPMKKLGQWANKSEDRIGKLQFGSMLGLSILLDLLYARRTLKSKKIEHDRKPTLAANFLTTMVFSAVGAVTLDKILKKKTKAIQERFVKLNTEILNKQNLKGEALTKALDRIAKGKNGIGIVQKTIVIALVYRFISPVIATPVADKVTKFMKKHGLIKEHVVKTNTPVKA